MHKFPILQSYQELLKQFEKYFVTEGRFPEEPVQLYDPCNYFLGLGGKRIRPVLCLMANELFGPLSDDALHAAAAIELFHNFTLIHDDIMDKAPLRRGQSTVHEKHGLTAGILCGDVMSIYAYVHLAKIRSQLSTVFALFNTTAIEVCEGQQLDMDFEKRDDVSVDEYIHMITLKTSVLLACGLKMGALIGGATGGNASKLYAFGKNLGIAFQLQDDYLDAFGSEEKTGKQQGGDILANKKTYLLLKAFEKGNDEQCAELKQLSQTNEPDKVEKVLALFVATGAREACKQAAEDYSQKAFDCLEEVAVTSTRKLELHKLATMLLGRET